MKRVFLIVIVLIAGGLVLRYFVQHPNLNRDYRFYSSEMREAAARRQLPAGDGLMLSAGEALAPAQTSLHHGQRDAVGVAECRRQPTRALALESTQRVYRWTGETGQSHFSDRPPHGFSAAIYDPALPERAQYFDLSISHIGERQVPFIRDQLDVSVRRTFQVLTDLLGSERLRQVDLNLRIFSEREDYREYARSQGAFRSAEAGGYYSHQYNEAVTFQYPSDQQTLEVARHEAVHVIVAALLGANTPLWLNEGLAVYFEKLHVAGQYAEISPNHDRINLARYSVNNGYPRQLTAVLRMDRDTWYGDARSLHYALGYSLVHFLMGSADGRHTLAALIRYKADNYCDSVDQTRRLSQAYPGGINALQRDFYAWIKDPAPKASHRY